MYSQARTCYIYRNNSLDPEQVGPDQWVQTVCKCYQQTILKKLVGNLSRSNMPSRLVELCIARLHKFIRRFSIHPAHVS